MLFCRAVIINTKISLAMMTSSNGNIFRVTGHLCAEFTCDKGQWRETLMLSQTIVRLVIWYAIAPTFWRHSNAHKHFSTPVHILLFLFLSLYYEIITYTLLAREHKENTPIVQAINAFDHVPAWDCIGNRMTNNLQRKTVRCDLALGSFSLSEWAAVLKMKSFLFDFRLYPDTL